ncbi:cytochrome P450 [Sphingosinicellaceae bacterium]|nr:cytochrome P450 [Sphingosinicellaceae bacterium]
MGFRLKYDGQLDKVPDWRLSARDAAQVQFDLERLNPTSWWGRLRAAVWPSLQRFVLTLLQTFLPRLRIGRLLILTRFADIETVLNRADDFVVPFKPDMRALSPGATFMLGLPDPEHMRQHDAVSRCLQDPQLYEQLLNDTTAKARYLLESSGGRIDVMRDYFTRVAAETAITFLGLEVDDVDGFADWTLAMSAVIFADPFGDAAIRELSQHAAWRFGGFADLAIKTARAGRARGLVRELVNQRVLDDEEIRAVLFGLAVALVPTITLAAGNALSYLLSDPDAWQSAVSVADVPGEELQPIIAEAMRLRPPLNPGQFRYVPVATELPRRGWWRTRVPSGTVVLAATAQGLRDPRVYCRPRRFSPRRPRPNARLVFGDGIHTCMGAMVAMRQLEKLFAELLRLPGLRRAIGPDGLLHSITPFPRRLDMTFTQPREPAGHAMTTILVPLPEAEAGRVRAELSNLGNPAKQTVRDAFDEAGIVHFVSVSAVDVGTMQKADWRLVVEFNCDGTHEQAAARVAAFAPAGLREVIRAAGHDPGREGLAGFLLRHRLQESFSPFGNTGLSYNGSRDFSARQITQQRELAAFASDALDLHLQLNGGQSDRPIAALRFVRQLILGAVDASDQTVSTTLRDQLAVLQKRGGTLRSMLFVPSRKRLSFTDWQDRSWLAAAWAYLCSAQGQPAVLAIIAALLITMTLSWAALPTPATVLGWFGVATTVLLVGVSSLVAFLLVIGGAAYVALRRLEDRDRPDERDPDFALRKEISLLENAPGYAQNHILACSDIKPGPLRRLTFALAMWGISFFVEYRTRPGFILDMGTIHFARWIRIDKPEKLLFLSNYDGSWESYLEDFVTKAHQGQTAAWSHGEGFPRTRGLVGEGAKDGDRFKRWVKRQQRPTHFWYSRYPELTLDRVRLNAIIHHGLARAASDSTARQWIACFGSLQRPQAMIETGQIQSLVLHATPNRPDGCYLFVAFGDSTSRRRESLAGLLAGMAHLPAISFGECISERTGNCSFVTCGLSARGLRGLEFGDVDQVDGLASFPFAYVAGMRARANVLGDVHRETGWHWDDDELHGKPIDGVLVVNAVDARTRDLAQEAIAEWLSAHGGAIHHAVRTRPPTGQPRSRDHFGFRDGISQPAMRGTAAAARKKSANDLVEAGEFVLGYVGNQGYPALAMKICLERDPANQLPDVSQDPSRRFPSFDKGDVSSPFRDFGRNGSFLVIRQIVQEVPRFQEAISEQAAMLNDRYPNLSGLVGQKVDGDWVAGKMIGRWPDGTPLVERSRPSGHVAHPTNDFSFAAEDPRGLACPLGAHIRRSNPRDSLEPDAPGSISGSNRHRMLRRGRHYEIEGEGGKITERGLMFTAICGDIERQFEFVQQNWINNPNFHGLEDEVDAIVPSAGRAGRFTVPTEAGPIRFQHLHQFTRVVGGGYFFLPSRAALSFLCGEPTASQGSSSPLKAEWQIARSLPDVAM